jgi:glycosyltransferase involved in cell wall biosynthesis
LLPEEGWTLDIFGDGPQRASLSRRVDALGLTGRVRFRGTVHGDSLRHELATFDRAILPSRFDGWGMLASEALSAGTPVICTDACGAVSLVAGGPDNRVVAAGRVDLLAEALADALFAGPVSAEARGIVRDVFGRKGSAARAASRFLREATRG